MQGILGDMDGALNTELQLRAAAHSEQGQISRAEMAKGVDRVQEGYEKVVEVSGARFEFKMRDERNVLRGEAGPPRKKR